MLIVTLPLANNTSLAAGCRSRIPSQAAVVRLHPRAALGRGRGGGGKRGTFPLRRCPGLEQEGPAPARRALQDGRGDGKCHYAPRRCFPGFHGEINQPLYLILSGLLKCAKKHLSIILKLLITASATGYEPSSNYVL